MLKSFKKEVEEVIEVENNEEENKLEVNYDYTKIKVEDFPSVFDVEDKSITDWKYYDNNLIIESNKTGTVKMKLTEDMEKEFEKFINKLLDYQKKSLTMKEPERDLEIKVEDTDIKLRFNMLLDTITTSSTKSFCCRKNSSSKTLTEEELMDMIDKEDEQQKQQELNQLKDLVTLKKLRTVLFVGATGTAKTTVQKKLFEYYPDEYSVFTIQDTNDLNLKEIKPNGNIQEIICSDEKVYGFEKGVVSALRWNPDIICISEIRKGEVVPFIEALETGHAGNTTVHAKSPEQAIKRITNLYNKYSPSNTSITEEYVSSLIDVIIHLDVKYIQQPITPKKGKGKKQEETVTVKKRYIKEIKMIGEQWKS